MKASVRERQSYYYNESSSNFEQVGRRGNDASRSCDTGLPLSTVSGRLLVLYLSTSAVCLL